jgi:hypothetical protein
MPIMTDSKNFPVISLEADDKTPIICVVDTSGSTMSEFTKDKTVFMAQCDAILKFTNGKSYRMIYWNSPLRCHSYFKDGRKVFESIVSRESLELQFTVVAGQLLASYNAHFGNGTAPHVGFDAILERHNTWVPKDIPYNLVYVTDGMIGDTTDVDILKRKLIENIKKLVKINDQVQIKIISVEVTNTDYSKAESIASVAGCDVLKLMNESGLAADHISEFITYTPNNLDGFTHISKIRAPPGYIPYGRIAFLVKYMPQFIEDIRREILDTKIDMEHVKIMQKLSETLKVLVKGKPQDEIDNITDNFVELFEGTAFGNESEMIYDVLSSMVAQDRMGKVNTIAEIRKQRSEFFNYVKGILFKDTYRALGSSDTWMTFPFLSVSSLNGGIIFEGSRRMVKTDLIFRKETYKHSAVSILGQTFPVLPKRLHNLSSTQEQAVRLWTRQIMATIFRTDPMTDEILHKMMMVNLIAEISDIPSDVKKWMKALTKIMLSKGKTNCEKKDMTEYLWMTEGNLMLPHSGKLSEFEGYVGGIRAMLNLDDLNLYTVWRALCLALCSPLDDQTLIEKQARHTNDAMVIDKLTDTSLMEYVKSKVKPFDHVKIPETIMIEYKCPVTGQDTSKTGGYVVHPHKNVIGNYCSPNLCMTTRVDDCPHCFMALKISDHDVVSPKSDKVDEIKFPENNPFNYCVLSDEKKNNSTDEKDNKYKKDETDSVFDISGIPFGPSPTKTTTKTITTRDPSLKRYVVVLRGTVGAGKTTFAAALSQKIQLFGGKCYSEGTDKYMRIPGTNFNTAKYKIMAALKEAQSLNDPLVVCIIDTCGDTKISNDTYFDINFSDWKTIYVFPNYFETKLDEYLSWTLRNVMARDQIASKDTNYCLSPKIPNGVNICTKVHRSKAQSVFGKYPLKGGKVDSTKADKYAEFLADPSRSLDTQVDNVMKIINSD